MTTKKITKRTVTLLTEALPDMTPFTLPDRSVLIRFRPPNGYMKGTVEIDAFNNVFRYDSIIPTNKEDI